MNMKIPKWAEGRNLYFLAGIEPFMKYEGKKWYVKTTRCNHCGTCCMNVPDAWSHGKGVDGHCRHLKFEANEYLCGLAANRPYKCCIGDGDIEDCSIVWKEVD